MMTNGLKYIKFFQELNEKTPLLEYKLFFNENSYFEDPFHKVVGVDKIYPILKGMYANFYNPRFEINECISQDHITYIRWKFLYQLNKKAEVDTFVGISRVLFSENGKVLEHVDFWDTGLNVYEKIPLIGSIIRYIKRKIHG
jgi:hypothetical protein